MRLVVICLIAWTLAAVAAEDIWVTVNYFEREEQDIHYWFGTMPREVFESLHAEGAERQFVKIERVCFFEYDDDDNPVAVVEYEDDVDTGRVLIPVASITSIVEMKAAPHDLVAPGAGKDEGAAIPEL